MNAIEVKNITKSYSDFTLDHINFVLPTGTIMGLVGENGAGKSTTIQLIMNALKADSGSISVLGKSNQSSEFSLLKQDIGIVLDEFHFPELLNAHDLNLILKHTYKNWDENMYNSYLKKFSLSYSKPFKEYSRGMKMKLSLASALSHHPKLLLLDEATGGLDPMARDEILDMLNEFTRKEDHSILISSHIMSDLEKICDYITFLHKGKLVISEEKDELLNKYAIVKLSDEDFIDLPETAIVKKQKTFYGYDVLIIRDLVNNVFPQEHTTLEDIILFLAKEDD